MTIGKVLIPHEADAPDCEVPDVAPVKEETDLATYPVGHKVAGELAVKLTEHHYNNTMSLPAPRDATCSYGAKKTAPSLLVMAHGTNNALLSMEDSLISVMNFHGHIKATTE